MSKNRNLLWEYRSLTQYPAMIVAKGLQWKVTKWAPRSPSRPRTPTTTRIGHDRATDEPRTSASNRQEHWGGTNSYVLCLKRSLTSNKCYAPNNQVVLPILNNILVGVDSTVK